MKIYFYLENILLILTIILLDANVSKAPFPNMQLNLEELHPKHKNILTSRSIVHSTTPIPCAHPEHQPIAGSKNKNHTLHSSQPRYTFKSSCERAIATESSPCYGAAMHVMSCHGNVRIHIHSLRMSKRQRHARPMLSLRSRREQPSEDGLPALMCNPRCMALRVTSAR